jgi:hypothetical protein
MTTMLFATLLLAAYCALRALARRADELAREPTPVLWQPVSIVCGNCSGDGISPRRTLLDARGRCADCGGTSYMLAARRQPIGAERDAEAHA